MSVQDIVEEQGWSLVTFNKLLLRFIEENHDEGDLSDFLEGLALEDTEAFDDFEEASTHGF